MRTPMGGDRPGFSWDREVDVIVLGCGAAGSAAAIAAHDSGAQVLILEKMTPAHAGGNTRVSGGIWFDNTNPERAAVYLRNLCGGYPVPEPVIRVWAEETARNTGWVQSLGAKVAHFEDYKPEYPELDGSDAYGGYCGVNGELGKGLLFDLLTQAVRQRGIEVIYEAPGRELVRDGENGPVMGVIADRMGAMFRVAACRGVILATGGFENNPQMVQDYLGLSSPPIWGTPAATGDGHRMAQRIGADLWHMDNMMAIAGLRAPGFHSGFAALGLVGPKAYIFVGLDGTRFVDESVPIRHGHALVHGRYELYPSKKMHVIFDESARRAGPIVPNRNDMPVGWNRLVEKYDWSDDNSVEVEKGWVNKAADLDTLAAQLGVDAGRLKRTIAHYNSYCESREDEQFGRNPETLIPLSQPPYYSFTSEPVLAWSNGGPRRNEKSQVLDVFGKVIPNLYAAGIVSSTYSWCKDGGFHIADALAFGRVAGRTAAGAP